MGNVLASRVTFLTSFIALVETMNHNIVSIEYISNRNNGSSKLEVASTSTEFFVRSYREYSSSEIRFRRQRRIVNLIACITASSPNILIVDYCSKGDLLNTMRNSREYMLTLPLNVDYHDVDKSLIITQDQQIQYAIEVAQGMEYLSSRGYIHRDIAARNVLIDDSNKCKIGDFGLCRKVEDEHAIYHTRGGRFPIKWMSPEVLRNYETSTSSDVWSFGILLFEIITLGGSPYPDWNPAEVLARLEEGERMPRPDNCPDAVFELMSECWLDKPEDRPTFTKLVLRLEGALAEIPKEYYPQIDAEKNYYLVPRDQRIK